MFPERQEPEILQITEDALELSEEYLHRKILTPKFRDDALHIAFPPISVLAVARVGCIL